MAKSRAELRAESGVLKAIDVMIVARTLMAAYKQWTEQDGPLRIWNGVSTKCISEDLHNHITEACNATADKGLQVEPAARGMLLVFDDLEYFFTKWIQDASMQLVTAPPEGSSELRNCFDRIAEILRVQSLPHPRPIKQLVAEKVSPAQIAIIYGWKNPEDNSPDTAKVHEEIEAPGTHYNAKDWVHPALRVIQAEIDREWATREPRARSFDNQTEAKPVAPVIPSLDALFEAKAPKAQIMRLHKLSEEEVEFEAAERGLTLVEERFIMPANAAVAHQERMAAEEKRELASASAGS
jgi:hypothetical protein